MSQNDPAVAPAHVLIVDDVPSNVALLADALGDEHELFFATSGEEAIAMAAAKRIDLILLDIMMPEVDGYEVCRLLQLDPLLAQIPVIFVTAKTQIADEVEGFAAGAVDYITKPISPPVVRARVRTHLELKASRDRLRALANLDGLTGLPNRPAFDDMLSRELRRVGLNAGRLSLLLLGLDRFRQYNERHGHLAADRLLRRLGEALASRPDDRPLDFVARYEGDRFALLCPDTDYETSQAVARDLLELVSELVAPGRGEASSHLTASVGGIALASTEETVPGPEPLLRRVEGMLARAKQNGRNQLWVERLGAQA